MSKATLEINGKKITLELTDEQIKQLTVFEDRRFKAVDGEKYFFIDSSGRVYSDDWDDLETDHHLYSQRNIFKTEEEAEKELERRKSLAILRDDAQDWVPDWKDLSQTKYTVHYYHRNGYLAVSSTAGIEYPGSIHFQTEALAEQSIKDHKEHWLRVFGVEK